MEQKCKCYNKTCFKKSEKIYKTFYHIVFLEICKSFHLMPKGLVARKRFCVGGTSKDFQKKWDYNLKETKRKYRDLLLEEYCDRLFTLMDSFWVEIRGKSIDICWLVKVRGQLDKIEKEQQRIKLKKLSTLSGNSSLKNMIFERFNEHLPHFQFKADFLSYCSSQCPEFENIYTLTTLNKTYKNHEEMKNAPQSCQDESGFLKVLNTEDNYNCEKDGNVFKGNNIAPQIGVRLDGKFVSKNVINLSRRNLSASAISLLSKGLKFVPTANKIDRAKKQN